ncbi:helix-turn-helix transcriptional regulator [Periweissella fabaria]|uniref:HTH cro/C1-type domain-containing protein n=1 Tax=Periweissella fabaria TaxID=546157 RepID=A0ABM8Z653_9LACO|nr:helix-turn-helix transcriptional regulator [Periweissella fabaria]MCM0597203.1 helix-turn-helix transcriptional regulator [Periweissella fabaria]CAH0416291.1 hypothetical protein WFA24289_00590 [Periweissella fabaria]
MKPLLGLSRLVFERCPTLEVPETGVTAVGIQREEIEKIRKAKGIKVQKFEKVLNLSRSRYYRWLQYETDLPLEFVLGIKKIIGLTNSEFLTLLVPHTEEFLDTLLVTVYPGTNSKLAKQGRNHILEQELMKQSKLGEQDDLYRLILCYYALEYKGSNNVKNVEQERLESYFAKVELFSLFDVILYLVYVDFTLDLKDGYGRSANYMLVMSWIKQQLKSNHTTDLKIVFGIWFDVAILQYFADDLLSAKKTLEELKVALMHTGADKFDVSLVNNLLQYLQNFSHRNIQEELILGSRQIIQNNELLLSSFEFDYWNQLFAEGALYAGRLLV